jgi:Protein of unknown function (DUF2809)
MTRRYGYVLAALATMAVGLLVHRGVLPLPPVGRDVLGDVLWATMIMWLVSAVSPRAAHTHRTGVAIAICWLLALRAHPLGHLVLGSDFDARDLLAYTVGVAVAWCVDWLLLSPRRIAE